MPSSRVCSQRILVEGFELTPSELDIDTGELLFEWSSLEHVTPDGMLSSSMLYESIDSDDKQRLFSR